MPVITSRDWAWPRHQQPLLSGLLCVQPTSTQSCCTKSCATGGAQHAAEYSICGRPRLEGCDVRHELESTRAVSRYVVCRALLCSVRAMTHGKPSS